MLERINKFLTELKSNRNQEITDTTLHGPDTIKNILETEVQKMTFLEKVNSELLVQITDPKIIKRLSYKDKKELLEFLSNMQNNSRNFIVDMADLCTKNQFLNQVLKMSTYDTITVTSDNGETFESVITEDRRRELTEMLRDAINDRAREQSNR